MSQNLLTWRKVSNAVSGVSPCWTLKLLQHLCILFLIVSPSTWSRVWDVLKKQNKLFYWGDKWSCFLPWCNRTGGCVVYFTFQTIHLFGQDEKFPPNREEIYGRVPDRRESPGTAKCLLSSVKLHISLAGSNLPLIRVFALARRAGCDSCSFTPSHLSPVHGTCTHINEHILCFNIILRVSWGQSESVLTCKYAPISC